MRGLISLISACLVALAIVAMTGVARADDSSVLVVDVSEGASELDADKVRAAIATELGAEVVKPSDPRAAAARGTLTVDVDRSRGELSVTYAGRVIPTTRRVPLRADVASARGDVATLAGNLARDEASELAAALRRQSASAAAQAPAKAPGSAADPRREQTITSARLQALLDEHARQEGTDRTFMWIGFFLGAASSPATSRLGPRYETALGSAASAMGSAPSAGLMVGTGALTLFAGSSYPGLAAAHRGGASIAEVEGKWREAARAERSLRRVTGALELSFSAIAIGAGTIALAKPSLSTSQSNSDTFVGVMFGAAAAEALAGIYFLATEGPVETGLHEYELTTGHAAPAASWLRHVAVGYAPGGGSAMFSAHF